MQHLDPLMIGQNIKEILECDLKAEYGARALYMEARACCRKEEDYVTMDLFEELLGDEEGHINHLETQLNLLNEIGIQNYGQLNAHSSDEVPERHRSKHSLDGTPSTDLACRRRPDGAPKQLVVFLHGYGADGNDLIGLGREWARAPAERRLRLAERARALRHVADGHGNGSTSPSATLTRSSAA